MVAKAISTQRSFSEPMRVERKEYQRLLLVTFAFFFLIALLSRLLPRAWRPLASPVAGNESAYAEAKRVANTVVPFVFMR